MRLKDKVAIVTGGGSGIGRAAALRFAAEGAAVVIADVNDAAAHDTQAQIASAGGRAIAVVGDLTQTEAVDALVKRTATQFGAPTILLSSAAITAFGTVEETEADELDRVLGINVRSMWLCAKAVIPAMKQAGGGSIVNLSSITGIVGAPGMAAYATSKGAIITLTRTLALEVAESQIRVNCICPASIDTPMLQASFERLPDPAAARARNVKRHPLGRFGTAEDVANLALFLASDESSFITGGTYVIDGGASIARRWQE
jgi:NAD(P)-dependent dehydrogenase (short-subunit alcohol dehydrogenase family)